MPSGGNVPNTCGTHAPYEPRVWILILKVLSLLWFIAILTIYLYAAACITLGWWPVGEPPALQAGAWFLSGIAGGVGAGLYAVRGFYRAVGPPRRDDPRGRYDPALDVVVLHAALVGGAAWAGRVRCRADRSQRGARICADGRSDTAALSGSCVRCRFLCNGAHELASASRGNHLRRLAISRARAGAAAVAPHLGWAICAKRRTERRSSATDARPRLA